MNAMNMSPEEIEAESFRIIDSEVGEHGWPDIEWQVVRRVIHTSADFEYARTMVFSEGAVERGIAALRSGCGIVTDTTMTYSGINTARLAPFGNKVNCHVGDPDVDDLSNRDGITHSVAAIRKALTVPDNRIFVIGNTPTVLLELLRLIDVGQAHPELIIALPAGFVGAEESKNLLAAAEISVPFITNMGCKGGSNVAAAVLNALGILAI